MAVSKDRDIPTKKRTIMAEAFNFSLILSPFERPLAEVENALFEAGCDDAILCFRGTTPILEFDREASSFKDALVSAVRNAVDGGVHPQRIEPDDLVPASEIARRAGVTREAVRLWTEGLRGEAFPGPRAIIGKSKIWSWLEVAHWLAASGKIQPAQAEWATYVAGFNLAFEMARARRDPDVWSAVEKMLADPNISL
jgi:hypothetical protein